MRKKEILYIVIPCYNEEEVLPETIKHLKNKMTNLINDNKLSPKSKVMFINDGSKDNTWKIIKTIHKKDNFFTGISLSRNRGHQNALLCGLLNAKEKADIIISMDADLQDDISTIDEMLKKYYEGNQIVYGVRKSRKDDSFFKKNSAKLFYKTMNFFGVDILYNHADYRLTTKKVLNELEHFNEVNLFLRGIFPLIGFKYDIVYYDRKKRYAGKTKYPLNKMINFGLDGITSFSIKPLRLVLNLGITILLVSLFISITSLIMCLANNSITTWNYIFHSIWISTGLQMTSIGVIAEYIGKINIETKKRPPYIVEESLDDLI